MSVEEVLKRIEKLKQEVDKHRHLQPEQIEKLLQKTRLGWSFHSNHIEGNSLTYGEKKSLI
jgi:hypothetical protein